MKKLVALFLTIVLSVSMLVSLAGAETTVEVNVDLEVARPASVENNPVIEGENPMTGLPASSEPYTPILLVLDNSETVYPHSGVSAADIMIQVPNQNMGNNKILALFANEYPEVAGPSRSARMVSLPVTNLFDATFVAWGEPPFATVDEAKLVNVKYWVRQWGLSKANKWYDMLGHDNLKDSKKKVVYIKKIHDELVSKNVAFEKRPFLFTDEPMTRGDAATTITMKFYPVLGGQPNKASNCVFYYTEGSGYQRESLMGTSRDLNYDKTNNEVLTFANVIVLRLKFGFTDSYYYMKENFVGGGQADIFQSGRYIKGSWYRDSEFGRLIVMDENGNELQFQRGKTFFVINNDKAVVSYE